jgi:hypothetical protein
MSVPLRQASGTPCNAVIMASGAKSLQQPVTTRTGATSVGGIAFWPGISGGPPGSRSRHLGIKSPGKDVAAGVFLFHQVAKSLVASRIRKGVGDGQKRRETLCNTVVGTGAVGLAPSRCSSLVKYQFDIGGSWLVSLGEVGRSCWSASPSAHQGTCPAERELGRPICGYYSRGWLCTLPTNHSGTSHSGDTEPLVREL